MSQCVPSWDLDDNPIPSRLALRSHSNSSGHPDVPMSDYEVAELTWENGQLAIHGLGAPKSILSKLTATTTPSTTSHIQNNSIKYAPSWPDKPRATTGTLESIVNQATRFTPTTIPLRKSPVAAVPFDDSDELVPWFDHNRSSCSAAASTSATMTMDALVPCSDPTTEDRATGTHAIGTCVVGCSTRVGSSSAPATHDNEGVKRARVGARVEWSGRDVHSVIGSATNGRGRDRESQHVTLDTCERELGVGGAVGVGFTSTSLGGSQTQDNTSYGKPTNTGKTVTADENDSVCHSTPQRQAGDEEGKKKANGKSSVSTKRSRAAAIHNQSERKRRDKINQRLKTLQKLVPNSSKTDKASMLDEVIDYLKQLQAQVQMMSRMNMQPMMLPMALQQQLQMSMMAPMTMGMGMGMGMGVMDMNTIAGRPNIPGISPVLHPSAFMPITSWDGSGAGDRLPAASAAVMPDPLSAFLASQPITMDAYSRMVAMYQQLHQPPPASSSKS